MERGDALERGRGSIVGSRGVEVKKGPFFSGGLRLPPRLIILLCIFLISIIVVVLVYGVFSEKFVLESLVFPSFGPAPPEGLVILQP